MEKLFRAVRSASSSRVWSRGVELCRRGAVSTAGGDDEELSLAVMVPGKLAGLTVTFYLDDEEWSCDCGGRDDPCEHVTAAVIALRNKPMGGNEAARGNKPADQASERATQSDHPVSQQDSAPHKGRHVAHRFSRCDDQLTFERTLVSSNSSSEEPLREPLANLLKRQAKQPSANNVVATADDLRIDAALGIGGPGWIGSQRMTALLSALDGKRVSLDGEPVEVEADPVGLCAYVDDSDSADGSFRLHVGFGTQVKQQFRNGAVLDDRGVLRPIAELPISARELATLQQGRCFGPDEATELVSKVIPALEARLLVRVRTDRLPRVERQIPLLALRTAADPGGSLVVWPTIVYGDPPTAEVVAGGKLSLIDHKAPVPQRDPVGEARVAMQAQESFNLRVGHPSHFDSHEAPRFARRLADQGFAGAFLGDGERAVALHPALRIEAKIGADRLGLSFFSNTGEALDVDPSQLLRAWRHGDDQVALPGGGWAALPADWLGRCGHHIAALLTAQSDDDNGKLPRCMAPDLLRLCEALQTPPPPQLEKLATLLGDSDAELELPAAALPSDFTGELRTYQQQGASWLAFMRDAGLSALLADDMGLGKTVQALTAIDSGALVVAPTSVLHSWQNELQRFRPALSVNRYHGAGRSLDDADVTLTSYALLRRDADKLAARQWRTVILDEAQQIKNPTSQVAQAAFGLSAQFRIVLTGTPVENRLEDLWSLFHFLARGLLGGRGDFDEQISRPIRDGDNAAAATLRQRIRPFVLRRLKRDVEQQLPPRTDVVLRCELDANERAVYDAISASTRAEVVEQLQVGGSVMAALEALLRLRQAACHPALVVGEQQAGTRSAKIDLLLETLQQLIAADHRALVFSQWTRLLDLIEPQLRDQQINFTRLDGSTRDRGAVVDSFQREDGPPVMLVSLKAGGIGLTLTAADHVFLLDPWWNPTVEDQAADRAHRIGQQRPVVVHRLIADDTVEERIVALQQRKRAIADVALSEAEATGATALSREDLLALLDS